VSEGKDGREGETRRPSKTRTAARVAKRRVRAHASAEKKLRAVKGAAAAALPPAPNGAAASPAPASAPPPASAPAAAAAGVGFPALVPPALAAIAPGLAQLAGASDAPKPDFERILYNMARLMEQSGKALAASLRPPDAGEGPTALSNEIQDAVRSIGKVTEHWLTDPAKAVEAQTILATSFLSLWSNTLRRLAGEAAAPVVPYNPSDKRFSAPEWRESPFFDFLRQAHAISVNWANSIVDRTDALKPHDREKAKFYVRQFASALAPSNFFATNPEVLRETLESNGENLVRGVSLLAKDIEAGNGRLKITRYDESKFALGVNLAMTPGKVVFRNDLIELIQYAPTTPTVYRRPLLIIPPWINKFYILDLNPEKSFVRYAVSQGLTVFIVSWVNPDSRHRDKGFEAYMREGIFAAIDAIEKATGESHITAIGYCIGGTLLAMTLAYMAETGEKPIDSASFFTTQTDFSQAGDLRVFVDEEHLRELEQRMAATGYLEASAMATSFNMLRPEDLIWSYIVNNYMRGKPPLAFDLLAWNSDATRMTAANHIAYLRGCYLENRLARGIAEMGGKTLHLEKVTIPIYHLATREDHIAPARSVFIGAQLFAGDVRFVVAGSGHIAGVVNPVAKPKYQYWTGARPAGAFDDWIAGAQEHPGSWWPDWIEWLTAQAPERVAPRIPGDGALAPLCDAPGEYVKVRY
jgi:polyhydroxyalkanoate synthase